LQRSAQPGGSASPIVVLLLLLLPANKRHARSGGLSQSEHDSFTVPERQAWRKTRKQ
jgi:hypothetical protein